MTPNDTIYVGKLGKAVGLDGSLKIHIESDFPQQFKKEAIFTTNKGKTLSVKSYNPNRELIRFEGIETVDDAKKLTNQELYSTIEATRVACTLKPSEFFWFDLMNCKIIDEEELFLGEVKDIQRLPLSDYFEVQTSQALQEKGLPKIFLIPYIELYVVRVDILNKIIYTKECFAILENS